MVLGKLPVPGRPIIWIGVGQGPSALAVGASGGCLDIFSLLNHFSFLSSSLWETARYRLKYWAVKPKTTNQPTSCKCNANLLFVKNNNQKFMFRLITKLYCLT